MSLLVFPDVNVWMALTLRTHVHHRPAWQWYEALPSSADLVFCRLTQLGFLRLLTNESVAGEYVRSQHAAWSAYDKWIDESDCLFLEEPYGVAEEFRAMTSSSKPNSREWSDGYLAAFAAAASMELVTFDRALSMRAKRAILLQGAS